MPPLKTLVSLSKRQYIHQATQSSFELCAIPMVCITLRVDDTLYGIIGCNLRRFENVRIIYQGASESRCIDIACTATPNILVQSYFQSLKYLYKNDTENQPCRALYRVSRNVGRRRNKPIHKSFKNIVPQHHNDFRKNCADDLRRKSTDTLIHQLEASKRDKCH